jgi:hypothetical protein
MSSSVRAYSGFDEFLEQNEPLRRALRQGRVGVVSPEEGATRIESHADMATCLRQGKSLGDLVKENLNPGTVETATETAAPRVVQARRRQP